MAAITIGPLEEGSWVHPGIRYGVDDVAIGYIMLYLVYYLVYHLYIICIYYLVIYVIQMVGLYLQFCWLQIKTWSRFKSHVLFSSAGTQPMFIYSPSCSKKYRSYKSYMSRMQYPIHIPVFQHVWLTPIFHG